MILTRELLEMVLINGIENREGTTPKQIADLVEFVDRFEYYFICVVGVIDSTDLTEKISKSDKIANLDRTFIDSITRLVTDHNGILLKAFSDLVIFYFPDTSNFQNAEAIENALECCLSIISSRSNINTKLLNGEFPDLLYQVSADYGPIEFARSNSVSFDQPNFYRDEQADTGKCNHRTRFVRCH